MTRRNLEPLRSLTHPLWVGALLVLLVNDHLLKGSALPGWFTGKLSDFAGPVVAAALLAVLARVRSQRGWLLSHIAVALGFAAINVSPALARWIEAATASTPFPWFITVDPTDLVGLLALPVSAAILGRAAYRNADRPVARPTAWAAARSVLWRRFVERTAIAVSALACMATSAQTPPCDSEVCQRQPFFPDEPGALAVGNNTFDDRLIRVRSLEETVELDCEAVLAERGRSLSRDLFGPAETWFVEAGRAFPLSNSPRTCTAYLIETEGMSPTILAWHRDEFPDAVVPTTTEREDPRRADIEPLGEWLELIHSTAEPIRDPWVQSGSCEIAPASVGVDWSGTPSRTASELVDIVTAPDGCHILSFDVGADVVLCVPGDLPFSAGDPITITERIIQQGSSTSDALLLVSPGASVEAMRGSALPQGVSEIEPFAACEIQHDECGNSARAAHAVSERNDEGTGQAGTSVTLSNGGVTHLVRVQVMPARDLACLPSADSYNYIEAVTIRPTAE